MLIAIRHPDGVEVGSEYAQELAKNLDGKTRIFNPRTMPEYAEALSAYKPSVNEHLILLATYYDLPTMRKMDYGDVGYRLSEWYFASKGGFMYGVEPEGRTTMSWVGELPKNPATIVKNAVFSTNRVITGRKHLGTAYMGRISNDPHTVIVGMNIRWNSSSGIVAQVVSSLPDEWGQYGNWTGVGFLPVLKDEKMQKAYDWLGDFATNYVAIGQSGHELLDRLEIEHGSVPLPTGNGRFNGSLTTPNYGFLIRTVAKTNENKLDWKP